jgi:hypothetical protein
MGSKGQVGMHTTLVRLNVWPAAIISFFPHISHTYRRVQYTYTS